ncbi:regulator of V-ATPase in vacuolar membrane protein 2 [[Candida] anglica]|uniref:Regulator of V-ATPase in vacuolar membrane protein 2 n=1 Tax=[Candida] anglica TaxID=148631 RepID=A0ABP0E9C4_9ASCO
MTEIATLTTILPIVATLQNGREKRELHSLVTEIIMPEFDQIIETLNICANMLLYNSPQHPDPAKRIERGPPVKLPVSSSKSEMVKGIITRDGIYVTHLSVNLREAHFNRHIHRITLDQPILLPQLITAKESIDNAVLLLQNFNADQNHSDLCTSFENILEEVSRAKHSLQLPTDPSLVFPQHEIEAQWFRPSLPHNLALDMYINQAELCIDLKNLHRVTEEPWCHIDPQTGKSYVDTVRDEMKAGKPLDSIMEELDHRGSQGGSPSSTPRTAAGSGSATPTHSGGAASGLAATLSHLLKPKIDPMEYVTKCSTYANSVVMVTKKIEVSSPDPLLVSTSTKLDSLENIISCFLHNLKAVN